ncbi:PQQ-like beta-propeller repeat protein [Ruania alkalisoli]|uniref:PQQ-like beta-propeller repeat protein n=1 Tax=Ruania alkalisoli TaxID=2779775 RepID=A0A7M1SRR2_9MICO|nr:zinc metallochaperone AztD [Ruania alkalisoli]QOR70248.1 PQQ-like beta-propeller repeat protein [Ruania alkalisoli]
MTLTSRPRVRYLALLGVLPLALAACSSSGDPADSTPSTSASESAEETAPTEQATVTPRIVITYDGGLQVLDATSLEVVSDIPLDGFNRINPAGDNRHVLVSTTGGFQVLDAGTWGEPHGDHGHYYTSDPALTDLVYEAEKPGHAVVHAGRTALFDDGTGEIVIVDSAEIADGVTDHARELTLPAAHHGVAVELSDGTLLVTDGTEEERSGVRVLDADGEEIAATDDCPGVHGEATAADEHVVIGCEDGVVLYADGELTKIDSPDDYGRIGNQAGSEESAIVLGDYKSDPDAELERPTRISLINTETGELQLVDLPSSYTFRSIARGDDGEALVLGTDGSLHVIDPESGELERSIEIMDAWEEPLDWQQPRPAIRVLEGTAYVSDPATNEIHAVDIETGEVWNSATLEVTPNEITLVSGDVPTTHDEEGAHEGHDHGDEDEADGHDHEEEAEGHDAEGDGHDHDHDHENE